MKRDVLFLVQFSGAVFIPGVKGVLKNFAFAKKDTTTEATIEISTGTAIAATALNPAQVLSGAVSQGLLLQINLGATQQGFFQFPLQEPIDTKTSVAVVVTGPTDLSELMLTVETP